jgi:hypothetical protein
MINSWHVVTISLRPAICIERGKERHCGVSKLEAQPRAHEWPISEIPYPFRNPRSSCQHQLTRHEAQAGTVPFCSWPHTDCEPTRIPCLKPEHPRRCATCQNLPLVSTGLLCTTLPCSLHKTAAALPLPAFSQNARAYKRT